MSARRASGGPSGLQDDVVHMDLRSEDFRPQLAVFKRAIVEAEKASILPVPPGVPLGIATQNDLLAVSANSIRVSYIGPASLIARASTWKPYHPVSRCLISARRLRFRREKLSHAILTCEAPVELDSITVARHRCDRHSDDDRDWVKPTTLTSVKKVGISASLGAGQALP